MHDPMVVVFDLHAPIPVRERWLGRDDTRWTLGRRTYTGGGPEYEGKPIDPWWRPKAWRPRIAGRAYRWWHIVTVWHVEPEGRDSGTKCKGMGSSDLTWHNVRWAWKHRHHLSISVIPYRRVRSWLFDRCDECGHRFFWKQSRHSYMSSDNVWHEHCMGYRTWRGKARERLEVLDLVADVWEVDGKTVQQLARNRGLGLNEESQADTQAWRVFYDLENQRKAKADA